MDNHQSIEEQILSENAAMLRRATPRLRDFKAFSRFYSRRFFSKVQILSEGYHTTGPFTYLATSAAICVAATLSTLYTASYSVSIDGVNMGVVLQQDVVSKAISEVEARGSAVLGLDYSVDNNIAYQFGLNLKSELSDSSMVEYYLYSQLDELGQALVRYQVLLSGQAVAVLEKESQLDYVIEEILDSYSNENTISAKLVESLVLKQVYEGEFTEVDELLALLTENTTGETTYTVGSGDTFNAIAYLNDMSTAELTLLNPDVDPNRLYINDVLQVKRVVPRLSVNTVETLSYSQSIPSPVEEVGDSSMYVGTSKITSQGTEGEAFVTAEVQFLNGQEVGRDIISEEVLQEPTKTIKAVGTAERPVTASYGKFIWPTSGSISSYFGGRYLYGSYDYHSGLDIAAPYGTAVVAADGGTVSFAGWRSSYGYLVIITHDNGSQTYYAHNSSLLVSSGQKVYRGQTIARVGSTGNSTGNHLHFEVRIGGQAVNPLAYLS